MKMFCLLLPLSRGSVDGVIYKDAKFNVTNQTNLVYAQGQICSSSTLPQTNCTSFDLLLDVYTPVDAGLTLRPAYILSHGGGNSMGSKEQYCFQSAAAFYVARGFVAFNIDYRLKGQHGKLPPGAPPGLTLGWDPNWQSGYPAVRDLKAAIRWVRANAAAYNVDPTRIVVSGGSAGATNSVAAGVTFNSDYRDEVRFVVFPTHRCTNAVSSNCSLIRHHFAVSLHTS